MAVSTTQSRLRLVQNAVSTDLSPIVEGARAAWDQVIDRVSDASNQSDNLTMSCVSVASASVPTPAESKSGLEKTTLAVETTTSSGTSAITHVSSSSTLVESSRMTSTDMFQRLLEHGCDDLTSRIDPGKYSSCRVAQGGFGDIWQGQLQDGMHVAVKVLRFALIDSGSKALKRMMREVYAWSKLDHENIHKLLGVTTHQGQLGMVSEWMTNGNLRDYLGRNPSVDRYKLCIQIAGAVRYIHDRDMIHGDIKAANILVSLDGVIKLTDFDYSLIPDCSLYFTDTTRVGCGTLRWMAPELVLQGNCQRNKQTDVYALGMTFLEAMTGAPPYYPQCQLDPQVVAKLVQKILPERPTEHFAFNMRGNETWKLLTRCWDHNPALRPTAEAALTSMSSCSRLGEESDG
ncbi:hypothetical protein RSAG8_11339, partial [Rhizoctonia solani AG-8 WAC10335]